jgi:aminomethyltransferase
MGLAGLEEMKPFGLAYYDFEGEQLMVSRTGFTGDLGYELWIAPDKAEVLWDKLFEAGKPYLIKPFGSDALNMARIETGFLQAGVDFVPAEATIRLGRSRSPFELGLGWLVDLDKPVFNGRRALLREKEQGSRYRFVILDVEGNKPADHSFIMKGNKVVGTVTSAGWCPTAKTNVAFAQLETPYGEVGEEFVAEIYYQRELHWSRVLASCKVIEGAVFNPARRRQTPAVEF